MATTEIPSWLYSAIGVLIVTNLATIGTLIAFIFRCGMFVANTNYGIKDAKESAVRAHRRIDSILQQGVESE